MIIKAIEDRYSVRKYKNDRIEPEILRTILEAARLAPSARNLQNWHFVVIEDEAKRTELAEICNGQQFMASAPVTIAVCAGNTNYTMTCGEKAYTIDAAIAGEHIVLQAVALGLGSCWIGSFNQEKIARLIDLPADHKVVALLPLGYPDTPKSARLLKPFDEVVSFNSFREVK